MKKQILGAVVLFAGEPSVNRALNSLSFADSITVVHDCTTSEDNVKIITKNAKVGIIHKPLTSFSEQRNFALEKVKSKWVFFLDADEEVSEKLSNQILDSVQNPKYDGYYIRRVDDFMGKIISKGELLNIYLLRLGRKGKGKWHGVVHETWKLNGNTTKIHEPIYHYPHPSIYEFISEIDKYTSLRIRELQITRVKADPFAIISYPVLKFIVNYVFKLGFLEGNRGFVLSIIMSFHSFLVRAKLYHSAHVQHLK